MKNFITNNFVFADIIPEKAQGSRVWDDKGNEYIDLAGGIAVNALGHCHPVLLDALKKQAEKLWHISNLYTTRPTQELAEKLVQHSFADKVFFANSGAEANEAALKLARKYVHDNFGEDKHEIVSCVNSFHGRTLFTVSVAGQPKYSKDFAPLPTGIRHTPFNDIDALKQVINDKTCAFIVEPIQGESGVLPANKAFLQAARELCDQFQAALIFDEVQTGMGRTGKLFAHQHYGVTPDILSSAKALGCGFPIGAMLCTEKYAAAFTPGSHGTTFGGNPLACAVGNAAFDMINNPTTYANIERQAQLLRDELADICGNGKVFAQIRGMGLLLGCVLNETYQGKAGDFVKCALQEKLMILQAGANVVRLAPSLLLTDEDRIEGIKRLKQTAQRFQAA